MLVKQKFNGIPGLLKLLEVKKEDWVFFEGQAEVVVVELCFIE